MSTRVLLIMATLAMLVSGCVSGESDNRIAPETTTTTIETASWLLVGEHQSDDPHTTDTYPAALLEGTLVIDMDARCVWVDALSQNNRSVVVVFPPKTVLRLGPPPELVVPDGTVLHNGDHISVGGGFVGADLIETIPFLEHLDVPETCSDISGGALWLASSAIAAGDSE